MTEIAVTDTHALVWYANQEQRRLGPTARKLFDAAAVGKGVIHIPTLALIELAEGSQRGRVRLRNGFAVWTRQLLSAGGFVTAPLTIDILLQAEELYGIPERGDRMIAATAVHLELPLITRDPEIQRISGVETLW